MTEPAKRIVRESADMLVGLVVEREGSALKVRAGEWLLDAQRAASCLVAPEAGDRVLVATNERECYVLSVLVRASSEPLPLTLDGPVALSVEGGRLGLSATEGIDLRTEGDLQVEARDAKLRADVVGAVARRVEIVAQTLESSVTRVRSFARVVDAIVDQVTLHAKQSLRFVSEIDQTRAGHIDQRAKETVSIHGKHAFVTAEGVTKVDADQIHIG